MTTDERVALLAARAACEVHDGMAIGLGSGSTAEAVVRALGARVREGLHFTAVATSKATAHLAASLHIPLLDVDEIERLDLGIDGADEIDPRLGLVKGRGGALLWEKLVARLCDHYLIVATTEKLVAQLGSRMPLPVEIVPLGWPETARRIAATGCTPTLRMDGAAPYLTDGGHYILDCQTGPIHEPASYALQVKAITGVVDHGLFIDEADRALVVDQHGEIEELIRSESGDLV